MQLCKEIFRVTERYDFMVNEKFIYFNETVCQDFLQEPLSNDSKKALIQAYYIYFLSEQGYLEKSKPYGQFRIKLSPNIQDVEHYLEAIKEKIAGYVSWQDIEQYSSGLEKLCNMNKEEIDLNKKHVLPMVFVGLGVNLEPLNNTKKMKI